MRPSESPWLSSADSLVDYALLRASEQPDEAYLHFHATDAAENRSLTFRQLDVKARTIAAHLQDLGIRPGDRALIVYNSCLEPAVALMGALYAGVVATPACPPKSHFSSRLCRLFQNSGARVCLTDTETLEGVRRTVKNSELHDTRFVATDQLSEADGGCWRRPQIRPNDLAVLQYTSGSTSQPRGVMLRHANLVANAQIIVDCFGLTNEIRSVSWVPWYHDMGLVGGFVIPLCLGIPNWLLSPWQTVQNPAKWLRTISLCNATISGGPNFIYDLCVERVDDAELGELDLSCWKVAFSGGEPIQHQTLREFAAKFEAAGFSMNAFCPCYGLAETTLFATGGAVGRAPTTKAFRSVPLRDNCVEEASPEESDVQHLVSCGGCDGPPEVVIVDLESRTRAEAGKVGEIWVRSPSNAQGYWRLPEETAAVFGATLASDTSVSFLRTGDLGFLYDGELYVAGRIKDLIIIHGENHHPQDIEHSIAGCHVSLQPHAGAAFSVFREHEERLVVAQEVRRTSLRRLDSHDVIAAIRRAINQHHGLDADAVLLLRPASLPRTTSGKIQRRACRAQFLENRLAVVDSWRAGKQEGRSTASIGSLVTAQDGFSDAHAVANWIRDWLTQRLSSPIKRFNRNVSFAEFGLDSVAAVDLVQAIRNRFHCALDPTALWSFPTIEALATHVACSAGTQPGIAKSRPTREASRSQTAEAVAAIADAPDLNMLSDNDLAALLEQELNVLKERHA